MHHENEKKDTRFADQLEEIKKYFSIKKDDAAMYLLEEMSKRNKIDVLFTEGIIFEKCNHFEDAIRSFDKLLILEKHHPEGRYHRAFCLTNLGRLKEARIDLQICLEDAPEKDAIHQLLKLTHTLEGKFPKFIIDRRVCPPVSSNQKPAYLYYNLNEKINPVNILKDFNLARNSETKNIAISVVVPVKDEEGSLLALHAKLKNVLNTLSQKYEIIFIDDGSTDTSLKLLNEISAKDPSVVIIKFRRNYGQTAAFAAGFKYASGDVVITMDADLQNDPADIPRLLNKMSEGYDLVCGWRKNRKDKALRRKLPSWIANGIINKLIAGTGIKIHDAGCSLKAYKKGIIKNIKIYGEMHRFIPAYAAWLGIKIAEIPVTHHPRRHDYSKYGLERLGPVVLDLVTLRFFTGFKTKPFQFFGKIATTITLSGIVLSIMLFSSEKLLHFGINSQTSVVMILFSILGGLQFVVVGLLSEIIMRGFLEAHNREEYVVEHIIDSPGDEES
ncbi:MAG: glycosyltransferase [Candidatus Brocadiaceae bacterium]|nr:glycosyltransferase [Candidatus Brocadiaceae bacterium]